MKTNIRYCKTHQKQKHLTVEGCPGCMAEAVADAANLRAKLQAAEEALAADDQASHTIEWKSRAEAAEAEAARLRAIHNTYYNKPFADAVSEAARTATEAALRWAWSQTDWYPTGEETWISRGLKALLGNNETNTNNQGERNA